MSENINNNNEIVAEVSEKELNSQMQVRREKLANLQEAGKDPFKIVKYPQDTHTNEIKENFEALEGKNVCIAGRMMAKRKTELT